MSPRSCLSRSRARASAARLPAERASHVVLVRAQGQKDALCIVDWKTESIQQVPLEDVRAAPRFPHAYGATPLLAQADTLSLNAARRSR